MTTEDLKTRYENLVNYNNTIMKKVDELRSHIHKTGNDPDKMVMLECYHECSYVIINENKEFNHQELINSCRSIEQIINHINYVHDRTVMAYRMHVPINHCDECDHNVTISYKMDMRFKTCTRCGNTSNNIRMIKIEEN